MFVLVQWNTSFHFCYRAVDGNREDVFLKGNTCTHTKDDKNAPSPFWVVDLGDIYRIQSVRIWNRNDCCSMYILFIIHTVSWLIWLLFLHLCSGIYAECEKNKTSIAGERLHDFKIQVSRNYDPQRTNANDIDSWDTCYHEKGRSNYVAESSYYDSGIRLSLKFSTSFFTNQRKSILIRYIACSIRENQVYHISYRTIRRLKNIHQYCARIKMDIWLTE